MRTIKKCFIFLCLFFFMPMSMSAIETDEVKKINFSEIDGDEENTVSYNADAARIETTHSAGETLLKTILTISSYDAIVPYQIFSFELGNQSVEEMELTVKIIGASEYTIAERQAVLLEGEQLIISYVNSGTFVIPGNFTGRIYIPVNLESEHIQSVELYSRNRNVDVNYYSSSFRVMNLTENEFINDVLQSKLEANQKQITNSLSEKYELEYTPKEGLIDREGNFTTRDFVGIKHIDAHLNDENNTQIVFDLNLANLEVVAEKEKEEVVVEEIIEPVVKPVEIMVDGFLSNKALTEKILPLVDTVAVVTPKNSFMMSGFFTVSIVVCYLGAFALAFYALIYLVKDFMGK